MISSRITGLLSACFAASLLFSQPRMASAADFSQIPASAQAPVSVSIHGEIRDGDFEKFRAFLLLPGNLKAYTNYIWLDSQGGNVIEAMKFANLFEKSTASVMVGSEARCHSACFIMFAGGADRVLYPFGELGVHQITVTAPGASTATHTGLLQAFSSQVASYLLAQGVPQAVLEEMRNTPASSMFILDRHMLSRKRWNRTLLMQPGFLDRVEKACGPHPEPDKSLFERQRDDIARERMKPWTACKLQLQDQETRSFVKAELALVQAGKPAMLFATDKAKDADAAISAFNHGSTQR
ncbi:MAG: hypothetical protein V4614_16840 [Pseudomonadota bacterium]